MERKKEKGAVRRECVREKGKKVGAKLFSGTRHMLRPALLTLLQNGNLI